MKYLKSNKKQRGTLTKFHTFTPATLKPNENPIVGITHISVYHITRFTRLNVTLRCPFDRNTRPNSKRPFARH